MSAAENYCRNPLSLASVWCYTMDPDMRWEYCVVPWCVDGSGAFEAALTKGAFKFKGYGKSTQIRSSFIYE